MADDSDLVYDGRARKRPPGANSTVIQLYDLLDTHPEGITLADAIKAMHAGFPTDGYRAFEQKLKKERAASRAKAPRSTDAPPPPVLHYGTPEFEVHAEHWWIRRSLYSMVRFGTARLEEDRWVKGDRAPRVQVVCDVGYPHVIPYDSKKGRAEDEARVRRAHLREEARAVLNDKKVPAKARKVIEELMRLT